MTPIRREIAAPARNQHTCAVATLSGAVARQPGGRWLSGADLIEVAQIADRLDAEFGGTDYRDALAIAQKTWHLPSMLPSARVLSALQPGDDGCAYTAFVREHAVRARAELLALPWSLEQQGLFEAEAQASLDQQRAIEAADTIPFETFRQDYVSPKRLMPG